MAIAQTKEENTLVMGTETDGIYDRPMILTYSKNGDLLATQKFSLSLYAYYTYWLTLNDNGTYITLLKGDPVSIIKWNKNGQPLWLAVSSNDQLHVASSAPYGIALLPDGRFIVALTVSRTISGDAVLLAQYDEEAEFLWGSILSTVYAQYMFITMALSKNEPVFLVVAEVKYGYGFLLIQFDFFGRQQWVKANIDSLSPRKIISTNDNHYFITGDLVLSYYNSIFLLKLDKRGNALWETILYGSVPYTSYGVAELVNGKIVIVGMIESYTAGCSAFIGLVDTAGNLLSANILFTDSMTADNRVYDVTSTDDGGFIVSGYFSEDYDRSAVTLKFNSQAQFDTTMLPSGVIWQDITHLTQQIRKSFILENMSFLLSHDFRFLLNSTTGPDTDPLNLLCNNTANNASNNKPTSHFLLKNKIIIGLTVSLLALGLIGYFGRNPERKKTQKTEEKSALISLSTKNQSFFSQEKPEINPPVTLAIEPNVISV